MEGLRGEGSHRVGSSEGAEKAKTRYIQGMAGKRSLSTHLPLSHLIAEKVGRVWRAEGGESKSNRVGSSWLYMRKP